MEELLGDFLKEISATFSFSYLVLDRLEMIKENFIFKSKIRNIKESKPEDNIDNQLKNELEEWENEFDFLNWLNKPGFLPDEKKDFLDLIAKKKYTDSSGVPHNYLTKKEHEALSVRKGNLTDDERKTIQSHIIATKTLLSKLPFPKKWKNVPFYAKSINGLHECNVVIDVQGNSFTIAATKDKELEDLIARFNALAS